MVECPADWKYCAIGKLACLKAGNDHFETSQCDGIYPWYGGNGVRGYSSCFTYDGLFPIVGRQGELCGNVKLAKGRFSATEHAVVVACGPEVLPNYFYYSLTFANLNQYATGCAQPGLSVQKICGVQILTPSLPEQRRIAAALGDMDKLIDNLSKRIEKKKAIKQSAMQELLTGKKRLPGFCGEWKKKTLGSSATVKARIGWQGLTTAEYLKDGDHFLVNGVNIENGHVNWQTCFMVDEKRYAQDKNIQLQDFDVLVSKDGTIGKVAYVENMPRTATLNSGVFVIRSVDAELSQEYLARVFLSMWFDDFIEKITAGSTIVHLYQKDIVKFAFEIPPSFAEQQAIAKVLSGMDAEIANLERKLEKLKFMKQGMMQDLLTGKVRLK